MNIHQALSMGAGGNLSSSIGPVRVMQDYGAGKASNGTASRRLLVEDDSGSALVQLWGNVELPGGHVIINPPENGALEIREYPEGSGNLNISVSEGSLTLHTEAAQAPQQGESPQSGFSPLSEAPQGYHGASVGMAITVLIYDLPDGGQTRMTSS